MDVQQQPVITLTTDFGVMDSYVAQMKGVILSINRDARVVDLSHDIEPQNIAQATRFIDEASSCFPPGTYHLIVVDPGVGTDRDILVGEINEQFFVCPDNGILTHLLRRFPNFHVETLNSQSMTSDGTCSSTFHGRDLMAPAIANWSLGSRPATKLLEGQPVQLFAPEPQIHESGCAGNIVHIDHYGNLISNIHRDHIPKHWQPAALQVRIAPHEPWHLIDHFAQSEPKSVAALIGSSGHLEVCRVNDNAATFLELGVGAEILLEWNPNE